MKIAVFGKTFNEDFSHYIGEFFQKLHHFNTEIIIYKPFHDFLISKTNCQPGASATFSKESDLNSDIDFLISIGGDGTFLEAVSLVKDKNIPLIGVNSGRLGFMANISKDEISGALDHIFAGRYTFEDRSLIEITSPTEPFSHCNLALNDVTIQKKSAPMITVHTYINDEYLNSYWTDGLIFSTPTGSTAYSLSVGGPIMHPASNTFVISPIASHNLTVRPIVIPDSVKISLKVDAREDEFIASVDNQIVVLPKHVEISLQKAKFNIRLIKLPDSSFYSTLRNKLMWGADKRN